MSDPSSQSYLHGIVPQARREITACRRLKLPLHPRFHLRDCGVIGFIQGRPLYPTCLIGPGFISPGGFSHA
ncbi:hypothetical protein GP475_10235 [Corynebacterium poyangense]|uniref:Uncharacterized protein n=1 Tax=Corynebacterium poyangense TaxID=2684405 RepID=A0A7H0SQZ1_9CORY|nr:hypothetical protein [Corynebacterium poyangense]MBZ8176384.1 hypothetical protein [Corynebacterium poyangense]QNQ90966.1 hypothetical protein GP475_10235 [Corynebacterium poyangense]